MLSFLFVPRRYSATQAEYLLFAVYKQPFNLSQIYKANCILFAERDCTKRNLLVCPSVAFKSERGGLLQMLRSIKKAFDMVRQQDAETAVTVHTIRMWCKEGKIKCLTAGNKVLVDIDSLMNYIAIKE